MISVVLLGTGNVATHLFEVCRKSDALDVIQVVGRNAAALSQFGSAIIDIASPDKILEADIYIIAVSDDSISSVAEVLTDKKGIVIHTSGSVPMKILATNDNIGVFYPLQTFSKQRAINFSNIPICIEANTSKNLDLIATLANSISEKVYRINSEQRKKLHLAAIFANNFTNYMYHLANEICKEHQVPFEILGPLIQETAAKTINHSPYQMQTGPARRHDTHIINKHLELLQTPEQKEIYSLLSASIGESYNQEPTN